MSVRIDFKQATTLLSIFGGEAAEITLVQIDEKDGHKWHSGDGLYAYFGDYPEEGAFYLGRTDEDAVPTVGGAEGGKE